MTRPPPSGTWGPTKDEYEKLLENEEIPQDEKLLDLDELDDSGGEPFTVNVEGIDFQTAVPPDPVGEIGRTYYIQMTNGVDGSVFAIYDKQGNEIVGPTDLSSLWRAGGPCQDGFADPIVLYDHLARRWLLSEITDPRDPPGHLCIYVSATSDPVTGGWFLYDFATPLFPDYPKYAVWRDAYYVSANDVPFDNEPNVPAAYALQRSRMLRGLPAAAQRFEAPPLPGFGFQTLTTSDLDGRRRPPRGTPNFFMRHVDDELHNPDDNDPEHDFLEIWEFHVDFDNPADSRFDGPTWIPITEFDSDVDGVPQPGTAAELDPLEEQVMWRLQYRNFGHVETLVGNFVTAVDDTDHLGIRWFELRRGGGGSTFRVFQEGTFVPDTDNRWNGSIAMDGSGNIALGYSISSDATFPSIRVTGRRDGQPRGIMTVPEQSVIEGRFSQDEDDDDDELERWGDYSSMNVDPVDDCTFWYTNEYVASPPFAWGTRIASFSFPGCQH